MNICAMLEKKEAERTPEQKMESKRINVLVAEKKAELETSAKTTEFKSCLNLNISFLIMQVRLVNNEFVVRTNPDNEEVINFFTKHNVVVK